MPILVVYDAYIYVKSSFHTEQKQAQCVHAYAILQNNTEPKCGNLHDMQLSDFLCG